MQKIIVFFKDCYAEMRKVSWPSKAEVGSSTKVILVSVALFALILGLIDFLFLTGVDILF